jgi:hypothetical protein
MRAFVMPPPRVASETVTFDSELGMEMPPYPPTYHSAWAVAGKTALRALVIRKTDIDIRINQLAT